MFVNQKSRSDFAEKYVLRADGRRQAWGDVERELLAKKRERYGALEPGLAAWLASPQAGDRRVEIFFRADDIPESLSDGVNGDDEAEHDRAAAAIRARLREQGASVRQALAELGARDVREPELMATFFATLSPEALRKLARDSDVTGIYANEAGEPRPHFTGVPNTVSVPHIDTSFNAAGFYGNGYHIGFTEGACEIWDRHESLGSATYDASNTSRTCSVDSDCPSSCGLWHGTFCEQMKDGTHRCVEDHVSGVASIVSARHGGVDYGSAKATLRLYNGLAGDDTDVACFSSKMQDAFNWFATTAHKAHTIVESWDCGKTFGSGAGDGLTEDTFARQFGWLTVKSAGNIGEFDNYVHGCEASNSLCVGGFDISGTAGVIAVAGDSAWQNVPVYTNQFDTDREDPDIMAFELGTTRGSADVMDTSSHSTTGWANEGGTSVAAPAIASMATLMKNMCGADLNEKFLRALLMTSSWYFNPTGAPYSSQDGTNATDYRDGAGGPAGENAMLWCGAGGGPISVGGGRTAINVDGTGGTPLPKGFAPVGPDGPGNTGFNYYPIGTSSVLAANQRVRATLVWDTCTDGLWFPTTVGSDLDFLFVNISDPNNPIEIASSRSVENNWEGFDVTTATSGTYQFWVAYDTSKHGCSGAGSSEPVGWAWSVGAKSAYLAYPH